jgi:hypothetical protein
MRNAKTVAVEFRDVAKMHPKELLFRTSKPANDTT